MSPAKRTSNSRDPVDVEQEVDFGRIFSTLARGWWLLLGGLLVGAVLGLALSLGSGNVYKAKATLYLGQPLASSGTTAVNSLATNPSIVGQLAHAEDVLRATSKLSGLPLSKLRSGVSTATVQSNGQTAAAKQSQNPLVTITVSADAPRKKVEDAANDLSRLLLARISTYPQAKIATLSTQIASSKRQIAVIDQRLNTINAKIASPGISSVEQQVLITLATISEGQRSSASGNLQSDQLLLVQALKVERGSVADPAVAVKTTARSRKNSLIVGAALGLLVGALCALLPPRSRRRRAS